VHVHLVDEEVKLAEGVAAAARRLRLGIAQHTGGPGTHYAVLCCAVLCLCLGDHQPHARPRAVLPVRAAAALLEEHSIA
jgi:hypothetical protein